MVPLPATLRIFPLGEVVHFPDTLLPLHVFELRYRQLVADTLAGDGYIGMALLEARAASEPNAGEASADAIREAVGDAVEKDSDTGNPSPPPAIYSIGCAGKIVQHKQLEDGRSVLVLKGETRFRVRKELESEHPYRVVDAQALYEAPQDAGLAPAWRDALREAVGDLLTVRGASTDQVDEFFAKLDSQNMVNYLSASLPLEIVEKQALLECATIERRYERLVEFVEFQVARARLGLEAGDSTVQ